MVGTLTSPLPSSAIWSRSFNLCWPQFLHLLTWGNVSTGLLGYFGDEISNTYEAYTTVPGTEQELNK